MKSPVGMEAIEQESSSEDCYQLVRGTYGLYAKQQDSSGKLL